MHNWTLNSQLPAINPLTTQLNYFLWQIQLLRSFVILIEWFPHAGWMTFIKPVHADKSRLSSPHIEECLHNFHIRWHTKGSNTAKTMMIDIWSRKGLIKFNSERCDVCEEVGQASKYFSEYSLFVFGKKIKSEWMRWMWRHLTLTRRFKFLPFGVEVVNLSSRRETRIGCECVSHVFLWEVLIVWLKFEPFLSTGVESPVLSLRSGLISFEVDLRVEKMSLLEI